MCGFVWGIPRLKEEWRLLLYRGVAWSHLLDVGGIQIITGATTADSRDEDVAPLLDGSKL
jgi:hypothetical protein